MMNTAACRLRQLTLSVTWPLRSRIKIYVIVFFILEHVKIWEYPYVAVPIATFLDTPLGILAADALEDVTQEDDGNPNEVISFLYAVANHLSLPIKNFFLEDIKKKLSDIENSSKDFQSAFLRIKDVILSLLPYSRDVKYVSFNSVQSSSKLKENSIARTIRNNGLVYIIHFVEAKCLINFIVSPTIKVQWNNTTMLIRECHSISISDETDPCICIIKIPTGMAFDDIQLQLSLIGTVDNKKRELSKRFIGLQQMSNDGAVLIDYNMECQYEALPYAHAGRLKFVS